MLTVQNLEQKKGESKKKTIAEWREVVDQTADRLGEGIEDGIKEAVVAFNYAGINTQQSCGGHSDGRGLSAPWISFEAPDEPKERYVGESAVFQAVAKERGLTVEEVRYSHDPDAYWEAMRRMPEEETSEYQKWYQELQKLEVRVRQLVDDFYVSLGEPADSEARLCFDDIYGAPRLYSGGKDYRKIEHELSESERVSLESRLQTYRAEMNRFTQWLIEQEEKRDQ